MKREAIDVTKEERGVAQGGEKYRDEDEAKIEAESESENCVSRIQKRIIVFMNVQPFCTFMSPFFHGSYIITK